MDLPTNDNSKSFQSLNIENPDSTKNKTVNVSNGSKTTLSLDEKRDYISLDDDDPEGTEAFQGCSKYSYKDQHRDRDDIVFSTPSLAKPDAVSGIKIETVLQGKCTLAESPRVDIDIDLANVAPRAMDEGVTLQANVEHPMLNIRKEAPLTHSNSGTLLFEF